MVNDQRSSLLTPLEVARLLHVSHSYAYKLLDQGKISYIQIGRCRRVHPDDLELYIQQNQSSRVVGK